jgi:thiol-disulfide isomerase/thioredoxin
MNGIYYLTHREHSLVEVPSTQGSTGGTQYDLDQKLPGLSMVLYYSKSCKFCKDLQPEFLKLNTKVQGVNFALANVSADNMKIQQMSEASRTPIRYVPYIVIYVNGKYYMEYRGRKDLESMARAIYEISNKIQTGQDFAKGKVCSNPAGQTAYCEDGVDDDDVCYLTYDEAYAGKPCTNAGKGSSCTYKEAYGV